MKKVIVLILSLILLGNMAYSIDLEFGIDFGGRTVSESEIKNVYGGTEFIYCPYISANITDRLTLGIGYEGGPRSEGSIGIYNEKSTFKISGFEVFMAYRIKLKKLTPFVKLGYGFYTYQQVVESEYGNEIDERKSALSLAGGVKYHITKRLFARVELKYVPMKVMPLDVEVDLSGLRYAIGLGYPFEL